MNEHEQNMLGFLGMVIDGMQRQADLMQNIQYELHVQNSLKAREVMRASSGSTPDAASVEAYIEKIRKQIAEDTAKLNAQMSKK